MEVLDIKGTDDTPSIKMDKDANIIEISGRSLPEDVATFYKPAMDWIDEYEKAPNDHTDVCFKLEYFNTASSKILLDILLKLEAIKDNVTVKWYFHEDEEDIEEAGKEYQDIVDLNFEFIQY